MKMTIEELIILDRFNKWADSLEERQEDELVQKFMEINGVKRNAWLTRLFIAFIGGMNEGFDIFDSMDKYAREKAQKDQ